jgi:hypothetical protein
LGVESEFGSLLSNKIVESYNGDCVFTRSRVKYKETRLFININTIRSVFDVPVARSTVISPRSTF